MANLREIKKRIGNASNLEKVSQSMNIVATSKLAMMRKKYNSMTEYLNTSYHTLGNMFKLYENTQETIPMNIISRTNNVNLKKHVYIFVTADRGLCGNYNNAILQSVEKIINNNKNNLNDFAFIPIGLKAYTFLKNKHSNLLKTKYISSEVSSMEDVEFDIVIKMVVDKILKEESSCHIVYTKSKSVLEQFVVDKLIFPIDVKKQSQKIEENKKDTKYQFLTDEKSFADILKNMVEQYLKLFLYDKFISAGISENYARLTAMDNAYNNCKTLKNDLTLEYNKTRQEVVTRELIEIVSGAEAI